MKQRINLRGKIILALYNYSDGTANIDCEPIEVETWFETVEDLFYYTVEGFETYSNLTIDYENMIIIKQLPGTTETMKVDLFCYDNETVYKIYKTNDRIENALVGIE